VSFDMEPGQLVALVGHTGAGKTTISYLVRHLYEVSSGSISINGVDVRDLTFASLQDNVGMVTQDVHLFHDTIRGNLLYARPEASEDELMAVLANAQLLDTVATLPQGLDTVVGDRGFRLSGGERQRLALARLMLKSRSSSSTKRRLTSTRRPSGRCSRRSRVPWPIARHWSSPTGSPPRAGPISSWSSTTAGSSSAARTRNCWSSTECTPSSTARSWPGSPTDSKKPAGFRVPERSLKRPKDRGLTACESVLDDDVKD
jgi:hypothetical protein